MASVLIPSKNKIINIAKFTGVIFLILLCISSLIIYRKVSVIKHEIVSNNIQNYSSYLAHSVNNAWVHDGSEINDCSICDIHSFETFPLSTIVSENEHLFICRISENFCESCNDTILDKFISFSNDTACLMRMAVIGKYNPKSLSIIASQHIPSNRIDYFSSSDATFPLDFDGLPYYFVLDKNLTISNIFTPSRVFPELTDAYFQILKEKYH